MANKKQKVTIYWNTRHIKLEDIPEVKRRIRERFGIPNHTTVNGETDCYIREEDMELLRETEKRGFIQMALKWRSFCLHNLSFYDKFTDVMN